MHSRKEGWFHRSYAKLIGTKKGSNPRGLVWVTNMASVSFLWDTNMANLKSCECHVDFAGADPGFFLGGGALVSCSTSTPINHIVLFFFCRIPVVLENRRSSQGGVRTPCTLPRSEEHFKCNLTWNSLVR